MSITQSVRLHDGRTEMETARFSFDPTSWRAATDRLRSGLATPTCLYSLERCEPEEAASREHVIPQATGTRWVDLPPGLVSDAVNGSMSEHEKELFQKGMLGALMPWYVTGKRSVAFVDGPVTVEFRNDPKDGFLIKATTPTGTEPFFLREAEEATSGTLSFPITVDEANPRSVSLVIHKIAYLALCVTSPDLAFASMLDETRGYLCEKDRRAFRPYTEAFLPGLMSEGPLGRASRSIGCCAQKRLSTDGRSSEASSRR